ncbi:undecaprenyl/decaprenyl-phosphate alpha-N-acetylglucosaminyl 1-phosphate transferase [Dyella flagellata]|uniref:Undecaprenyl-phosphate alpha-N-acetylglucosaminyl 1-phosphate transferase n=1 Tax=Dyella flagellata TaxID=1867833 RepID=A0ABQ5XDZ9_9GAMM|nr:undecaprenyl/decaprenyl-phosphate alpha-N-acetylglucosaminyl 1-phosphate transferase [Dyella flagellata]GLQ89879.1 undecaprenyl-phosphate alpha-N-acetylglucosaminyl 1-phosphate transferase [Dyella flagellata]
MQYRMLVSCVIAVLSSAAAMILLYHHAESIGLVDRPDERKRHVGNVPLIGGLSAFFGVIVSMCFEGQSLLFTNALLGTGAILALTGAMDDRFDLSVRIRLLIQAAAVLTMVYCTGVYIHTLGHLFGYNLELGSLGIPLTLVAVVGLLNAFNMMDGIDGLAGMLTLVSIGAINVFQGFSQWHSVILLLLLAAALLPDLAANMGLIGRKVFLGDAGSVMIGYFLAWTLIQLSQQAQPQLSTLDVLWCVALPVLDTLQVMARRMGEGKSPFKPDRGHIHHIMMNAGFSAHTTLVLLIGLAMSLVFMGTLTRHLAPGSNLMTFGAITLIYVALTGRIYRAQQTRKAGATSWITPLVRKLPLHASAWNGYQEDEEEPEQETAESSKQ